MSESSQALLSLLAKARQELKRDQARVKELEAYLSADLIDLERLDSPNPPLKQSFQKLIEHSTDQAEDALRRSEALFRATFEQAAVGIAHVTPAGGWLRVNEQFCTIVGYTTAELLGKRFQDITHPDDLASDMDFIHQLLQGEIQTYTMHKRYFHKSG